MTDENSERVHALTNSPLLAKNTLWNLSGRFLPVMVALVTIPFIVRILGPERFGILSLALTFVGYFGLLDLGLGRALTQFISQKIGEGREKEIPTILWTGLIVLLILSVLGMFALLTLTPVIVHHFLNVPPQIAGEIIGTFYVLGLSIPFVIGGAALWGVIGAYQRFDLGNRVGIPMGMLVYIGPLLALLWIDSLVAYMTVLVIIRAITAIAFAIICLRIVPNIRQGAFNRKIAPQLITFGGWITLSGIIGPLMGSLDRFFIAGVVSLSAVAFYTAPSDLVSRFWMIPDAFLSVIGPAFTVHIAGRNAYFSVLFRRASTYLFLVLFPITIIFVVFAKEGLAIWLGENYAAHSARVLQFMAIGMFFSCLNGVAVVLISSFRRPDIIVKLQLIEIPLYYPILYGSIIWFGIDGAAAVWAIRLLLECIVMFLIAGNYMHEVRETVRYFLLAIPPSLMVFGLGIVIGGLAWKFAYAGVILIFFALFAWFRILPIAERSFLIRHPWNLAILLRTRLLRSGPGV
jgi:O-antigen/teichoic acid export membrane protein